MKRLKKKPMNKNKNTINTGYPPPQTQTYESKQHCRKLYP